MWLCSRVNLDERDGIKLKWRHFGWRAVQRIDTRSQPNTHVPILSFERSAVPSAECRVRVPISSFHGVRKPCFTFNWILYASFEAEWKSLFKWDIHFKHRIRPMRISLPRTLTLSHSHTHTNTHARIIECSLLLCGSYFDFHISTDWFQYSLFQMDAKRKLFGKKHDACIFLHHFVHSHDFAGLFFSCLRCRRSRRQQCRRDLFGIDSKMIFKRFRQMVAKKLKD